jgi:DNA replication protein DnaC
VLAQRVKAFREAKIPARHFKSTRQNWDPSGTRTQAFMAVNGYIKAWDPEVDNRGLVLYGDVGRGKTHLLVALLRDLIFLEGVTARFVEFSHLVGDIKAGFDVGQGTHALLDPLVRVDVLAIDELGKGRNTEFEGTIVDELVSRRYNAASVILATTNYEPGNATGQAAANFAAKNAAPSLVDRVGDRVYSRLREMCDFVKCAGTDYRDSRRASRR